LHVHVVLNSLFSWYWYFLIQESEDGQFVLRTIDRSRLWEIQTPQVIRKELLIAGFEKVKAEKYVSIFSAVDITVFTRLLM
jgi:2-C-methyl-D-erythritol 4-phosphate cytidylyltransferase